MLGRRVPGLCAGHPAPRPLFEPLDRRDEQTVFDIVVRRKVAFAGEDVKKHAVQLVGTARRVITDDDPLQFGEFRLDLVVVPAEYVDRIAFGMLPPEQPFDIGENFLFLIVHVLVHFGDVLVEEPQDGESHVVMAAIDRLDQLAADGRKPKIEEIVYNGKPFPAGMIAVALTIAIKPVISLLGQNGVISSVIFNDLIALTEYIGAVCLIINIIDALVKAYYAKIYNIN